MDDTRLQESVDLALSCNSDLMDTMIPWALQLERTAEKDDGKTVDRCWTLINSISDTLKIAKKEADNSEKMAHYIADKAIKNAVTRLATQMRTQNPQTPMVAVVLETFFSSPQSNDKRKDLEARIKAKMGLSILGASDESEEFTEKVEFFEEKAGELALEFAIEDAKKMVDENLRMLAMA
ncbi:hypothetical protein KCU77_g2475, partial [Aureobasidium melanogenum]